MKNIPHLATLKPALKFFIWPLWFAKGATGAGCGLVLAVRLQERHLYPGTNFKLNRAAALDE
jgi:hypothetical protein